jgi:hypothetical protein
VPTVAEALPGECAPVIVVAPPTIPFPPNLAPEATETAPFAAELLPFSSSVPVDTVVVPVYELTPERVKTPEPDPASVKFLELPKMLLLMVTPPLPSIWIRWFVEFPRTTFIVLPDPVSLFCRVSVLLLELRRITLETPFTVAPFNVKFPEVDELLPMVKFRVLADVTSIAPIERALVSILIPAVFAVPAFAKVATSEVVHAPEAVEGLQFAAVYQAVEPLALAHVTVSESAGMIDVTTNARIDNFIFIVFFLNFRVVD